jgi:SOS-response transcriptional repressor LexA
MGKRTSYEQVKTRLTGSVGALSASTLHRYEKEGRVPDLFGIVALAKLYRIEATELFQALQADLEGRRVPSAQDLIRSSRPGVDEVHVETGEGRREFVSVPVLSGRIAAGPPLVVDERDIADHVAFSPALISQLGVTDPVCVRVGRYERSMIPTIRPGDTVLLDCSDAKRENPRNNRIYAVNVEEGSTLKRVAIVGGVLTLMSDNLDKEEYPVRTIECDSDTQLRSVIVGEAVWSGTTLL